MKIQSLKFGIIFLAMTFFCSAQELQSIHLLSPQTEIGKPLMQALSMRQSSRSFDTKSLPLQEISNLLWAADGINRAESGKRTAPSAMNWQEVDIYVILAQGTFVYNAKTNSLDPISPQDLRASTGSQAFVKDAPMNLVYVADYARTSRASDEDRKFYTAADIGFIAENVYLYCASQGLGCVVRGMVDRASLAGVLKLRPDQKVMLAQTVGYIK